MAKDKKSFLLYCDLIHTVKKMPKEMAGELFLHILQYVNDENPTSENLMIELTFEPIKHQLKRDLVKYEAIRLKNVENARKRWDKKDANECERIPSVTKNADNDTDNDTVIILDNKENLEPTNQSQKIIQRNETYKTQCETDTIWIENIYMKKIVAHGKITFALKDFNTHLVATGELKHDLKDYKTHFTNWAKLQK